MTCCVTAEAEKKSRQLARRLARDGRQVLVAGCAATRDPAQFAEAGIEVVADGDFAAAARRTRPGQGADADGAGRRQAVIAASRDGRPRARFNLKVQDGCAGHCTYCIVRTVRGRPRSLPLADAVAAATAAVERGCREVVLTGINLGAYAGETGRMGAHATLADLVIVLADLAGLTRLRLSSLEPEAVDGRLLEALAHPVVARHLHLPLQSADDAVLRAMGRRYDMAGYRAAVATVRSRLPDVMLGTDVIAGFPAEDEAAFRRTMDALHDDLFGRVHVFAYSPRPGTPAARLGRLPASVVKARAAAAGEAAADAQRRAAARAVGRPAEVLVEDQRDGLWRGYSSQYVRYHVRGEARPGVLVRAVALEPFGDGVLGRVETILT